MKDTRVEDYRLEIETLQRNDFNNATNANFDSAALWSEHMLKQDKDEIAEAIIDISKRLEIPLVRVIFDFGPIIKERVFATANKLDKQTPTK